MGGVAEIIEAALTKLGFNDLNEIFETKTDKRVAELEQKFSDFTAQILKLLKDIAIASKKEVPK